MLIIMCAGTTLVCPELAMEDQDKQKIQEELESTFEDDITEEDDRLERRKRREGVKVDEAILDGSDEDDGGRNLRSSSPATGKGEAPTPAIVDPAEPPVLEAPPTVEDVAQLLAELPVRKQSGNNSSLPVNPKFVANKVTAKVITANPSGAGNKIAGKPTNLYGVGRDPPNPGGGGFLKGQSDNVNMAYRAVSALRNTVRNNKTLNKGRVGSIISEKPIGSFADSGDDRASLCHFRSLVDRKQNISFSFNPKTLKCEHCEESHVVCDGEGGGKTGVPSQ
jgi:hypothetical protein